LPATATTQVSFPSSLSDSPPCSVNLKSCVDVVSKTSAFGSLTKLFGIGEVHIHAHARAAVTTPSVMKNVAPVAVKDTSACAVTNPTCYGPSHSVPLIFDESNVSSSTTGLINLTCHSTLSTACGSSKGIGASELAGWMDGYSEALPANEWYGVKTGESVGPVRAALNAHIGVPLFFPVFDTVDNDGQQNYFFHIIGWARFVITSVDSWGPQGRQLTGYFVKYTTSDLPAGLPLTGSNDFGIHVITLTQ